jgi:hypothetical protein
LTKEMSLDLFIIDASAPFFIHCPEHAEINWSKINFSMLEKNNRLDTEKCHEVIGQFESYIKKVNSIGYNAISLDDLAHCVSHSFYPSDLSHKISDYQSFYLDLFKIVSKSKMKIFINSDVMFFNKHIEDYTHNGTKNLTNFFVRSISKLLKTFPEVSGVILRIGEADGVDVREEFHSRLVINKIRQLRYLLRAVLPVFERYERYMILRTWTLGAYEIGDMIWNEKTLSAVLDGFESDFLVTSHKYGESDFYRYLNITPSLFTGTQKKILELQARREYEGFGEFPSFTGFDHERYARYLQNNDTLIGISVWCQTGGWSHFKRLTFVKNSSVWNELNVFAAIMIFKYGYSAEKSIIEFSKHYFQSADPEDFIVIMRLAEKVIKELWYIPEFSSKRLYFRRTRVPPLLWIFWDTILINHTLRKILRRFVHERREAIADGYRALYKINKLKSIAIKNGIPVDDIEFQYATFNILAIAREYFLGQWDPQIQTRLETAVKKYNETYPHGFHFNYDFSPTRLKKQLIKSIFWLSLRSHPHYRIIDKLFLLRFAGIIYPIIHFWGKRRLPDFTRNQAMGIQTLFR